MDDVLEQLQPALDPGERILWAGRSDPGVMLAAADGYLIPLSLFYSGFSVLWIIGVSSGGGEGSAAFSLFGLPFLLVGLFYLFGRFLVKRRLKRITAYAITNRRALVQVGKTRVHEARLDGGSRVIKTSHNQKHITVIFDAAPVQQSFFGGWGRGGQVIPNTGLDWFDFSHRFPVAFYDVSDVDGLRAALARVSMAPSTQSSPTGLDGHT